VRAEPTKRGFDLLAWAQLMGGWDAPCWQRAAELLGGAEPTEDTEFDRVAGARPHDRQGDEPGDHGHEDEAGAPPIDVGRGFFQRVLH